MATTPATVVYLRRNGGIHLARKVSDMKHRGGVLLGSKDKWNGYGGKKEEEIDEDIEATAIRELKEESGISVKKEDLIPAGHIEFFWPENQTDSSDMDVYFYFVDEWQGEPSITDQMKEPRFFLFSQIPYYEMMPEDKVFLPKMIEGYFAEGKAFLGNQSKTHIEYVKTA